MFASLLKTGQLPHASDFTQGTSLCGHQHQLRQVRWSLPETELHKGKFLLGWSEAPPCHPDTAAQIPSCCILELPSELLWRSRIPHVLVLLPREMCSAEGSIEQSSHFPAQDVFGAVRAMQRKQRFSTQPQRRASIQLCPHSDEHIAKSDTHW